MAKVRIEVLEAGKPAATITVPIWAVKAALTALPKIAGQATKEHVDIDQIVALAKDPQASGVLLDIEDHKENKRVVISIVGDEPAGHLR